MPKSRQLPPSSKALKSTPKSTSKKQTRQRTHVSAFAAVRLNQLNSKGKGKDDINVVGQKRKQTTEHGDDSGKKVKFTDDNDAGKKAESKNEGCSIQPQNQTPNSKEGRVKRKARQLRSSDVEDVTPTKEGSFNKVNIDHKSQHIKSSKRRKQENEADHYSRSDLMTDHHNSDHHNTDHDSNLESLSEAEEKFVSLWETSDADCSDSDEDLDCDKTEAVEHRYGVDSALVLNTKGGSQLLVLRDNQEIGVRGKCRLLSVCGVPSVLGYKITKNNYYDIYSPDSTSLLTIKSEIPEKNQVKIQKLFMKFQDIILQTDFEKLLHFPTESVTVVKLDNLKTGFSDYITTLSPFQKLLKLHRCSAASEQGEIIYRTFALEPKERTAATVLNIDNVGYKEARNAWLQAVSQKSNRKAPSVVVIGPQNSGKSTLLRYLINSSLNQVDGVYHLECDVGQSEFTPPGCIALHRVTDPILGPPFCHQTFPAHTYYHGGLSSSDNPIRYLECIRKCYSEYCKTSRQDPLVVNTPGWITGYGQDILVDLIRIVKPDYVIQLTAQRKKYFGIPLFTKDMVRFHRSWMDKQWHLDIARNEDANYTLLEVESAGVAMDMKYRASDHRNLKVLGYMGKNFDAGSGMTLSSMVPYKLDWKDIGIHVCHETVTPAKTLSAINASIVALCSVNLRKGYKMEKEHFWLFSETPVCKCLGFGLVRAVDTKNKHIYISTPLSQEELSKVNLLMKGATNIPQQALLNQKAEDNVPYVDNTVASTGASSLIQRRHMPRKHHTAHQQTKD